MHRPKGRQGGRSAPAAQLSEEAGADAMIREFESKGFVAVPSALPSDRARHLRVLVEQLYQDLQLHDRPDLDLIRGDVSVMRVFEHHRAFRDLLELPPIIDLVERILGPDCHVVAQNALRTAHGTGIVNWHIDDALFFPLLADLPPVAGCDARVPCYSLNVLVALSNVEAEGFGPTQVVAGSHLWGTVPVYSQDLPVGVTAGTLLARAGDAFLVNSQTWHRGALNQSDRVRYLITTTYGRRFISQRFFPFLNYRMPASVLEGASERALRLLGQHAKGPYG